jgi:hypothetical protein
MPYVASKNSVIRGNTIRWQKGVSYALVAGCLAMIAGGSRIAYGSDRPASGEDDANKPPLPQGGRLETPPIALDNANPAEVGWGKQSTGILVFWLACAFVAGVVGSHHQSGYLATFYGLLLGPLGIVLAFVLDGRPQCPECNGRLDGEPRVCRHCRAAIAWGPDMTVLSEMAAAIEEREEPERQARIERAIKKANENRQARLAARTAAEQEPPKFRPPQEG